MAKLEGITGGLANLKKQLDAKGDKSVETLEREVRILGQAVAVVAGQNQNIQQQIDHSQSSIKSLISALKNSQSNLDKAMGFVSQLSRIEDDLKKVPRAFPESKDVVIPDNSKAFKQINDALKKLPTAFPQVRDVELTPLMDTMLAVLDKVNVPVVIPKAESRKSKWTFTVVRDEQDLITKVLVS